MRAGKGGGREGSEGEGGVEGHGERERARQGGRERGREDTEARGPSAESTRKGCLEPPSSTASASVSEHTSQIHGTASSVRTGHLISRA
eukprot:1542262-Rhodomonas_salina.1